ncbi:MAG: GAF domain-containing protein [Dehalococcoidia bacterium]
MVQQNVPLLDPAAAVRNPERLAALRATALLDSKAEAAFDRLTRLATRVLRAPVALVSLVDDDRQFFKSCIGLPEPWASARETPLSHSFCQYVVATSEPLIIEDARKDSLLRESLAIPDLGVVAYVGMPLATAEGMVLGSFCVIDHVPRAWTEDELAILGDLAASATAEIALRESAREAQRQRGEVEALTAINLQISAKQDLDQILQTVLGAVRRFAGADMAGVALLDEHGSLRTTALDGNRTDAFSGLILRRGPSLAWRALETGVAQQSEDYLRETCSTHVVELDQANEAEGVLSVVVLPIHLGTQNAGVCWANARTPRRFTPGEISILERLAAQAAIAIDNARALGGEQAARREAETLAEISRSISASLDLPQVLQRVAEAAALLVNAEGSAVVLTEEGGDLRIVATAGIYPGEYSGRVIPAGTGLSGRAVQTKTPVQSLNYSTDAGFVHGEATDTLGQEAGVVSILALPIMAGEDVIGAVLISSDSPRTFGPREVELLERLTVQAAIALENVRIFRQEQDAREAAQQAEERTARLLAITAALSGVLMPEQVANVIVNHGGRALKAAGCVLALLDENGTTLEIVRTDGYRSELVEPWQQIPLSSHVPLSDAVQNRQTILMESPEACSAAYPHLDDVNRASSTAASASVPLLAENRVIGALGISFGEPHSFSVEEQDFLTTLAQQCATALERSRLYEAERTARAEVESLAEARALHEAAAVNMTEGLALMDPDGVVRFWNRRMVTLLNIPAADALGRKLLEAKAPTFARTPDPKATEQEETLAVDAALRGEAVSIRCTLIDSEPRELKKLFFPIYGPRGLLGLGCLVRDITQDQMVLQLKDELVREADQANRAKSEFLSRMSHELRTPMNAILGFAQLLQMDPLEPEQQEELGQILSAGRHLLTLINEVLDIARIESGRLSLSLEAVPLQIIVEECLPLVGSLAAARSVGLSYDETAFSTLHVRADNQRLKQVLLNLLTNAVKYNREGGTVTLSCHEIGEDRLRIEVRDTGIGLAPEMLSRLFSPFDRLGAEQSDVEGYGLGLSLSKRLMEAMGSSIGVTSVLGEGSCFWVDLPVVQSPVEFTGTDAPQTPEAERSRAASTVLYIEDNLSNLRVVERVLSRRPGVQLLTAMQGGLGFELAQQQHPDLILLDLHLPDTTGDLVLQRLRADPTTHDVPVVMVSADATPRQIERLLAAGAREYLTKPLDLKRFMEVVDEVLAEGER